MQLILDYLRRSCGFRRPRSLPESLKVQCQATDMAGLEGRAGSEKVSEGCRDVGVRS